MHQALMACQERKIQTIWVYDPSAQQLEGFGRQLRAWLPAVEVKPASSVEMLLDAAQIVISATTAVQPVLPDQADLLADKTYIAIGSFKPDMQELPDALFHLAETVFCDTEHALAETGDLINPLNSGILHKSQVVSGGRLISGQVARPEAKVQIWKSVGMALFDLAAVVMLYEEALKRNAGQRVEV
jgi:ornithine cyclodeaminase